MSMPLLGVKETYPRNPLKRFILISHWPQWRDMPLVKPVTERLTYPKYDKSSGIGDGDSVLEGVEKNGYPSKSEALFARTRKE